MSVSKGGNMEPKKIFAVGGGTKYCGLKVVPKCQQCLEPLDKFGKCSCRRKSK